MNHKQIIYKNLPEKDTIWSLVGNSDFKAVIEAFQKAGVPDHNIGELLFSFVDKAIAENKFHTAISILIFLTQNLENKSEAPPLLKKIGDIYTLISEYEKAREYYGQLPLTLENIKLCFQTYLPPIDINGLLSIRDMVLSRIPEKNHDQIHALIHDIMLRIAGTPEVFDSHLNLFKKNTVCLKKIPPFTIDSRPLEFDWPSQDSKFWRPSVLKLSTKIYRRQNKVWQKIFSTDHQINSNMKKIKGTGSNIMVLCDSPESLFDFISRIQTDDPEFIKYECRIIIDFHLLRLLLTVIDLSPLKNCDFVIRFIDKKNLKPQLMNLLLERKLPFTNRVVYLSQNDSAYFSNHVIPTLKECEKKMLQNVEIYEQQLLKIFPDNFHETVIQKIKTRQKLKILFFTSKFTTYLQHSIRDMAEGFRQLGHTTFIEKEEEDSGVSIRKDVCLENLINFQPDIIFSIDHFRYEYPWVPKIIPFITWIQDLMPHMTSPSTMEVLEDQDHVFSFSQKWINTSLKKHQLFKGKKIHLLPITVSTKEYSHLTKCKKKYDVTFISHLPNPVDTYLTICNDKQYEMKYSISTLNFIKKIVNTLEKMSLNDLFRFSSDLNFKKKIIEQTTFHTKNKNNGPSLLKFFNQKDEAYRLHKHWLLLMKTKPIDFLMGNKINVRVFGRNWEKIKNFADIAMGPIENGHELNKVLNQSRINLNISPGTSYHMKAPEVIATKNFMLTRKIPKKWDTMPIDIFYTVNKEIILFDDENDLLTKVRFFLKNKPVREKIAEAAYRKYIATLTNDKSAEAVLNKICYN